MKKIMKKVVLLILISFCFAFNSFADEQSTLDALEMLKASTESGVNYQDYSNLVTKAKFELDKLKRSMKYNKDFFEHAERALKRYQEAKIEWTKGIADGDVSSAKLGIYWLGAGSDVDMADMYLNIFK